MTNPDLLLPFMQSYDPPHPPVDPKESAGVYVQLNDYLRELHAEHQGWLIQEPVTGEVPVSPVLPWRVGSAVVALTRFRNGLVSQFVIDINRPSVMHTYVGGGVQSRGVVRLDIPAGPVLPHNLLELDLLAQIGRVGLPIAKGFQAVKVRTPEAAGLKQYLASGEPIAPPPA